MSSVQADSEIVEAMRGLINVLHEKFNWFNEEELENTPIRVAKFFEEWYAISKANIDESIKSFTTTYDGIIIDSNIPVIGMCSHHLLPIIGKMHIAYIPDKDTTGNYKVLGLSKLSRIAKRYMFQPMIQENFTDKVLADLVNEAKPFFAFVMVSAQHDCKRIRGARDINSIMTTVRIYPNNEKGRELEIKVIEYLKLTGILS